MHCEDHALRTWLQKEIESTAFHPSFSSDERIALLHHLNKAELFETFLHTKFVGQKRFSLEGAETLIPILNEITTRSIDSNIEEIIMGMAHRGRLNVLTNILKKSVGTVFAEFEDSYDPTQTDGSGDVKYHKGYTAEIEAPNGKKLHLSLTPNASHLESVDP